MKKTNRAPSRRRVKISKSLLFILALTGILPNCGRDRAIPAANSTGDLPLPSEQKETLELCASNAFGKPSRIENLKPGSESGLTSGYINHYGQDISFDRRVYLGGVYETVNYKKGAVSAGFNFLTKCFANMKSVKPPKADDLQFEHEYKKDFLTCVYKVSKEGDHFEITAGCQS